MVGSAHPGCGLRGRYASILAFDVPIDPDARVHADQTKVTIFTDDTIYRLFEQLKTLRAK